MKNEFIECILENSDILVDDFYGLPVAQVEDGNGNVTLIPWFDKDLKYDGDLYFHMKGGWSRFDKEDGTYEYERTVSRIHLVDSLSELYNLPYYKIDENGLYYVTEEERYFKVKDIEKHNSSSGWYTQENISKTEIDEAENIIDNNKGNNPHAGNYDGGSTYLDAYAKLFANATFNNARKDETEEILEDYGFNILRQVDNTKTVALMGKEVKSKLRGKEISIQPNNVFTNETEFTEIAGTSIMNNKQFHIVFDDANKEFIENDVLPYVKQLIPSTTLFSYSFEHLTGNGTNQKKAHIHQIVCNGQTCPIYGIV